MTEPMQPPNAAALQGLLEELRDPTIAAERADELMRSLDGQEVAALPTVFRWLHDATDEEALHAATRLLVRWKDRPVAAALPRALRALVRERDAGDLNKIAAAGVLAVLGEPLHDADLAPHLADPSRVKRAALRRMLEAGQRRLAIVQALDALGERPAEALLPLIDDLGALGDPKAARLLGPLAHHGDGEVAVAAVAALDGLAAWRARAGLKVVAEAHPVDTVREQAALTRERLAAQQPEGQEPPAAVSGALVRQALLPAGRRVLVLSAPGAAESGERQLLTLHLDDTAGIVESAALDRVDQTALEALEARLEERGARLDDLSTEDASVLLEAASARTLSTAMPDAPLGWTAWRELLAPWTAESEENGS